MNYETKIAINKTLKNNQFVMHNGLIITDENLSKIINSVCNKYKYIASKNFISREDLMQECLLYTYLYLNKKNIISFNENDYPKLSKGMTHHIQLYANQSVQYREKDGSTIYLKLETVEYEIEEVVQPFVDKSKYSFDFKYINCLTKHQQKIVNSLIYYEYDIDKVAIDLNSKKTSIIRSLKSILEKIEIERIKNTVSPSILLDSLTGDDEEDLKLLSIYSGREIKTKQEAYKLINSLLKKGEF